MNHSAENQWTTAMLCPENTTISVKVLLDDSKWMMGSNQVFTGGQRLIEIYPSFNPKVIPIVEQSNIVSSILNNSRKCSLFYPPSYYDNTLKKYEVLIMHDGQNLFNDSQAAFGTAWHVQDTILELVAEGKMR